MKTLLLPLSIHRITSRHAKFLPYVRLSRPKLPALERPVERGTAPATTPTLPASAPTRATTLPSASVPSNKLAPFKWPWWWEKT